MAAIHPSDYLFGDAFVDCLVGIEREGGEGEDGQGENGEDDKRWKTVLNKDARMREKIGKVVERRVDTALKHVPTTHEYFFPVWEHVTGMARTWGYNWHNEIRKTGAPKEVWKREVYTFRRFSSSHRLS